ncbi:MAG: hypothetical protein IPN01_35410 [Deltaproteobacteria bacterium]|nr:hypothetical protein [Deltaproteobacteria bacterium]
MKRRAPPLLLMLLATVLAVTPYLLPWALIQWSSVPTTPYVYIPPIERPVVTIQLPPEQLADEEPELEPEPAPEPEEVEAEPVEEPAPTYPQADVLAAKEGVVSLDVVAELDGPKSLRVGRPRPVKRPPTPPGEKKPRPPRKKPECLPEAPEIGEVSPTAHRVEEQLVDYYANHLLDVEQLAASWWKLDEEGERVGVGIGRMKCGSLLRQGGFKNGDVIVGVNGMPIQSWSDGVNAFLKLRTKRLLWVDVVRRGGAVRLDFLLVDPGLAKIPSAIADPLLNPTVLVDQELARAELPWLKRTFGKGKDRREQRKAERALWESLSEAWLEESGALEDEEEALEPPEAPPAVDPKAPPPQRTDAAQREAAKAAEAAEKDKKRGEGDAPAPADPPTPTPKAP